MRANVDCIINAAFSSLSYQVRFWYANRLLACERAYVPVIERARVFDTPETECKAGPLSGWGKS